MIDGPNQYAYVRQGPTNNTDPLGRFLIGPAIVGGIIGGIAGALVAYASGAEGWEEYLTIIGEGVAFGVVSAIFPVMGTSPFAFAIANAITSAMSNLYGQVIDFLAGKGSVRLEPLLTSIVLGALIGLLAGGAALNSVQATRLAQRVANSAALEWELAMGTTIMSGAMGGLADSVNAYMRRLIWIDSVTSGDSDDSVLQCTPLR